MIAKKVVTSFLQFDGKILILKRSDKVKAHKQIWAGISGYIEKKENPLNRAIKEIEEETGLSNDDIELIKASEPIGIPDKDIEVLWIVYPHLFKTNNMKIDIDWEHTEYKWIYPETLSNYITVPALTMSLQMVLPILIENITSSQEVIEKVNLIKNDKTHGASWLASEAIEIISLASREYKPGNISDYLNKMKALALQLMNIRPSIGTINNRVGDILCRLIENSKTTSNLNEIKEFVNKEVKILNKNSERNIIDVSKNCIKLFPDHCKILTHSYSSTIIEAIKFAYNKKEIQVFVTESRPLFEGRKTANELSEYGIPTTLITDAAAGFFAKQADILLVGADSLLTNGDLINKAGTYPIILAAAFQGIPVYIASDTGKINLRSYFTQILLEEKDIKEIWNKQPPNLTIRNLYFDTTPKFFITRIITEMQQLRPEELLDLSRDIIMDRYIV